MLLLAPLLACVTPSAEPPAPAPAPPPPPAPVCARVAPVFRPEVLLPVRVEEPPATTSIRVFDDVVAVADPRLHELQLLSTATWTGPVIAGLGAPLRAARLPDGSWAVADIGVLWPSEARAGRVLRLREREGTWATEVLAEGLGRVACAEVGDLDGDGDADLTVCEFGHVVGGLHWLESEGENWIKHTLAEGTGWSEAWPVDVDGDGDLDLAALVSQAEEAVAVFENGPAGFTRTDVFTSAVDWFGMSGLTPADLDRDGDVDLLFTHGDTMDSDYPPELDLAVFHGVDWLENDGRGRFAHRPLLGLEGAYAAEVADLDGDCDLDVAVAANRPGRPLVWLENDGASGFTAHDIAGGPSQAVDLAVVDADGDGDRDLLVGSLYVRKEPGAERLVLLRNHAAGQP